MVVEIPTNREEATDLFLDMLISRADTGVAEDMQATLEAGRFTSQVVGREKAQEWYRGLDPVGRKMVLKLVREAAERSVFGALVVLDGMTGGFIRRNKEIEFAVQVNVCPYSGTGSRAEPELSIRVNPAGAEPLHDRYKSIQQDRLDID